MIFDRQGLCLMVNGPGLAMMGLSESDVLQKNLSDFWPEDARPKVIEKTNQVLGGIASSFEGVYIRPDGEEVLWSVKLTPLYSNGGGPNGFASISTDITNHRRIEDELERYREHLQKLVDQRTAELNAAVLKAEEEKARAEGIIAAVGDGISIHGTDFRILYQNQAMKDLLGDHAGEYCYKAYQGKDSVCGDCQLVMTFNDGKIHKKEGKAATDKGDIYTEITASPLRDSKGKIIAGVEVVRDITGRKISEETLRQTNERLRTILDASPAAIIAVDLNDMVTIWSKAAEQIFGWSEKEMIGHFYPVMQEVKAEKCRTFIRQILDGQPILSIEVRRRRKDGSSVDIMISSAPLYDYGGKVSGILSVVTDITQTKRADWELRLAHEELKQIFNTATEGMVVIDKDFKVIRVNDTLLSLLGVSRKDVFGKKCYEIFPSGSLCHTSNCPMDRTLRGEESVEFETEKQRQDGTKFPAIIKAAPFRNPEGDLVGIVESIRDISDRKKMEEMILKAKNLESIGILAGGIAHDFNNLFQGIVGNISIAAGHLCSDDKAYRYIKQAENILEIAKSLTGQLRTFSKGGEPVKRLINIGGKIRKWVSFSLSGSNLKTDFRIEEGCCRVEIDEGQIRQVIQNLVLNARDAMPHGGTLTITVHRTYLGEVQEKTGLKEGMYMKISVKDEGIGIPEQLVPKIFDPYFSTKTTGNQKGTGLGLTICYSIMNKHGGAITAESNRPEGSTFTIFLPVSEDKAPEVPEEKEFRRPSQVCKGRVLVMDDEKMILDVARIYLEQLGYECETAKESDEAVEIYRKAAVAGCPFDAVILDLTVPKGKGGISAIAGLLKINPNVKALVSSGYSEDPAVSNYKQLGFQGVLAKPYTIKQLSDALLRLSERFAS